jgi:hypothetical protein
MKRLAQILRSFTTFSVFCLPIGALPACGGDGMDGDSTGADAGSEDTGASVRLSWTFSGLPALGADYVYEGWIMVDGAPVSTGRFTVDDEGVPSSDGYDLADGEDAATAFILSIEPASGDDPAPSATKLLGGDVSDGSGTLDIGHAAALGDGLSSASASYILNTPTTASDDTDFSNGIWWLDPGAGPGPSATLPTLPAGWVYEGWVVTGDGPITTGTFSDAAMADSDEGGPTAGPDGAPPFPGQDFIDPAINLIGGVAVISIEPMPDDDPAPFVLKPLMDTDVEDVGIGVAQDMANVIGDNAPTGSVTIG